MQTTIFSVANKAHLDACTNPPPPPHLSSTLMMSLVNYTKKTGSSSPSPLTHEHGLVPCYKHSSPPPTSIQQKPRRTTHTNNKYHRPNTNPMYECASQPPCPLGILISAHLQWSQSASTTWQTFYGNSYTAPKPSLHTVQLLGLSI
jgi:hypothetical protein